MRNPDFFGELLGYLYKQDHLKFPDALQEEAEEEKAKTKPLASLDKAAFAQLARESAQRAEAAAPQKKPEPPTPGHGAGNR